MWAHYADKSKGFCVEYKFPEKYIDECFARSAISLMPVVYSDENIYKNYNLIKLLKCCCNSRKNKNKNLNSLLYKNLLYKGKCWEYEGEWRIIHNTYGCEKTRKRKIKMPEPKAIYLGYNITPENKEKLINAVIDKNAIIDKIVVSEEKSKEKIDIYECHLSKDSGYNFNLKKVEI